MSTGKVLLTLVVFGLLFWLIDHWFYWLIVGWVVTTIVSENIDSDKKGDRIKLTGMEIAFTGAILGLVLYGVDWLFVSVI